MVVVDGGAVGVRKENGWVAMKMCICKGGAKQTRLSHGAQKLVKRRVLERLPVRVMYKTRATSPRSSSIAAKKPAASVKRPAAGHGGGGAGVQKQLAADGENSQQPQD